MTVLALSFPHHVHLLHPLSQQALGVKATLILLPQATFSFPDIRQVPIHISPNMRMPIKLSLNLGAMSGGLRELIMEIFAQILLPSLLSEIFCDLQVSEKVQELCTFPL